MIFNIIFILILLMLVLLKVKPAIYKNKFFNIAYFLILTSLLVFHFCSLNGKLILPIGYQFLEFFPEAVFDKHGIALRSFFLSGIFIILLLTLMEKKKNQIFWINLTTYLLSFFVVIQTDNYYWWILSLMMTDKSLNFGNINFKNFILPLVSIFYFSQHVSDNAIDFEKTQGILASLTGWGFILLILKRNMEVSEKSLINFLKLFFQSYMLIKFLPLLNLSSANLFWITVIAYPFAIFLILNVLTANGERELIDTLTQFFGFLITLLILNTLISTSLVLMVILLPVLLLMARIKSIPNDSRDNGHKIIQILLLLIALPTPISPLFYLVFDYVLKFIETSNYAKLFLFFCGVILYMGLIVKLYLEDVKTTKYLSEYKSVAFFWPIFIFSVICFSSTILFLPETLTTSFPYLIYNLLGELRGDGIYSFSTINLIFMLSILVFMSTVWILLALNKKQFFERYQLYLKMYSNNKTFPLTASSKNEWTFLKLTSARNTFIQILNFTGTEIGHFEINNSDKKIAVGIFWLIIILVFLAGGIYL